MINIENNGKSFEVTDSNVMSDEYLSIRPTRKITLKPKEKFCFKTKITITCDSELDECWIYSDPIFDKEEQEVDFSDNIGIITQRITKDDGAIELNLVGGYMGEEEVVIPKGAEIARIYKSIRNIDKIDVKELLFHTLYRTDNLIIKADDSYLGTYSIVTNPDGISYIHTQL